MKRLAQREGFSLIEVLLALGIFSFSIVALVGLLSVLLSTGLSSSSDTTTAAISHNVINSMRVRSFPDLVASNGTTLAPMYFDSGGGRLTDASGADLDLAAARAEGAVFQCVVAPKVIPPLNSSLNADVLVSLTLNISWPLEASGQAGQKAFYATLARIH